MGFLDLFRSRAANNQPRIRNAKELKAFILDATKDEQLAILLTEVADHVGRYGYIEIERGGYGHPYSAEFQECPMDPRPTSEIEADLNALKQSLSVATTVAERDRVERQIAKLAGVICVFRISAMTTTPEAFEKQKLLILNTWARFKEIIHNDK